MKKYSCKWMSLALAMVMLLGMVVGMSGCLQQEPVKDKEIAAREGLKGKVISILSASTSTFAGYIPVNDGFNLEHRARYPQSNLLTDVNETWWMQLIVDLDAKLGINDSWAGSQVFNNRKGNSGDLGEDACMASLTRIRNLGSNGTPDVILFYGGGNDVGRLVPLGTFDPKTAPTEVDLSTSIWQTFADAYTDAVMRLQYYYPDALLVIMLPPYVVSYYTAEELALYSAVMVKIAEHYGVPYIDLRETKTTRNELPDGTHPNALGMDYITELVTEKLLQFSDLKPGENKVYSVSHSLKNAEATKGYIKGISAGGSFREWIKGSNENVKVIMGGVDITDRCYRNGTIYIEKVTGNIRIVSV